METVSGCSRVRIGSSVRDEVVCFSRVLYSLWLLRDMTVARHDQAIYPGKSRRDHTTPSTHSALCLRRRFFLDFFCADSFAAGPDAFRDDVLKRLGGPESADQFDKLLAECQPLMEAAGALPSLSLRSDKWAAVTMLRCKSQPKQALAQLELSLECLGGGRLLGPSVLGFDAPRQDWRAANDKQLNSLR